MENLKFYYFYFYYKIYNSIEYTSKLFGGAFLSGMKAGIVLIALEFWLVMSMYNYYTVISNNKLHLSINEPIVFIPFLIILSLKMLFFTDTKLFKKYKKKFDSLPSSYNKKGSIIVTLISLLVLANLIFSFYLLSSM